MKLLDRFALRVALVVLALSAPLYLVAAGSAPAGTRFTGSLIDWPGDASYHLTWPRQAADGDLLFEDKFNGERVSSRLIFNWYFLLLGALSRLLGSEPVHAWYVAQLIWILLTCGLAARLGARFFPEPGWQRLFLLLAVFGGGLGWLRPFFPGLRPGFLIDLEMVETIPFAWMRSDVIVPPTVVLMLLVVLSYLAHLEGRRAALRALALGLLGLAYLHPHDCVPLVLMIAGFEASRAFRGETSWAKAARLIVSLGAVLALPALHYFVILQRDPHLWGYVQLRDGYRLVDVAFGFPWHLLAAGPLLSSRLRGEAWRARVGAAPLALPALWAAVCIGLLVTPTFLGNQHYLLHGLPFALSLLAVAGLRAAWQARRFAGLGLWTRRAGILLAAAAVLATSAHAYARDVRRAASVYPGWYLPEPYFEAFAWLRDHAGRHETALATEPIGHQLTRYVGLRVWAAQPEQTPDYFDRMRRLQAWLGGDAGERGLLGETRARWLVLAKAAAEEPDFVVPDAPGLKVSRKFGNALVVVYRVEDASERRF